MRLLYMIFFFINGQVILRFDFQPLSDGKWNNLCKFNQLINCRTPKNYFGIRIKTMQNSEEFPQKFLLFDKKLRHRQILWALIFRNVPVAGSVYYTLCNKVNLRMQERQCFLGSLPFFIRNQRIKLNVFIYLTICGQTNQPFL